MEIAVVLLGAALAMETVLVLHMVSDRRRYERILHDLVRKICGVVESDSGTSRIISPYRRSDDTDGGDTM